MKTLALLALLAGVPEGEEEAPPVLALDDWRVSYDLGIRIESADQKAKVKLAGRAMFDAIWISEDDDVEAVIGDQEDSAEARRIEANLSGRFEGGFFFQVEYKFTSEDIGDSYAGWSGLPWGGLRIGHPKEPLGLDEINSSGKTLFMEPGLPHVFYPGENIGFYLFGRPAWAEERLLWQAGAFRESDGKARFEGEGDGAFTGRVTGLPWLENDGRELVHLGVAVSLRSPADSELQYDSRPEVHVADDFVDTGIFEGEDVVLTVLEGAAVFGPLFLQGEYASAQVRSDSADDPCFRGWYVQAGFMLTGEHRPYEMADGTFGRIAPANPFRNDGGTGAVELAVRYSHLDLEDGNVTGGEMSDVTVGVNWYMSRAVRVVLNVVHADLEDVGTADAVMMRFQFDF